MKLADPPAQTVCGNGSDPMLGAELTATNKSEPPPVHPLALDGVTVTLPAIEPQSSLIKILPWPLAIVAPEGTVHVYVVAPLTLEIEYDTLVCPWHTVG